MTKSAGQAPAGVAPSAGAGSDLAAGILPLVSRTHHLLMLEFGSRKAAQNVGAIAAKERLSQAIDSGEIVPLASPTPTHEGATRERRTCELERWRRQAGDR